MAARYSEPRELLIIVLLPAGRLRLGFSSSPARLLLRLFLDLFLRSFLGLLVALPPS
jgi:hypothetical protein